MLDRRGPHRRPAIGGQPGRRVERNPYQDTVNQIYLSAPSLTRANLTIQVSVNGTACSTDTTCLNALASAQGRPASVSATYPCDLSIMGHDFAPGCTLSSQTTERIE